MRRRSFLKIAGVLSAPLVQLPASTVAARDERGANDSSGPATDGPWEVANPLQKLVVTAGQQGVTFQSFVRNRQGHWQNGSLPLNPFIFGPSFRVTAHTVSAQSGGAGTSLTLQGSGQARAPDGSPFDYPCLIRITNPPGSPWFQIAATLRLPRDLKLQPGERVEPQIILWLSSVSTLMEGQAGSWRRILLSQPTHNSLGARGNDLPAVYLQDANVGVETMLYFDMSAMSWMSLANIPRFLCYRCSTVAVLEQTGNQRLGIGLVADQATGDLLPAGEVHFAYSLLQRSCDDLLTERQALSRWMEALQPLFTETLDWPPCAGNWKRFAQGTVQDLQQQDYAGVSVNGYRGLRAYVKATSELWHESGANFELMTVADVLWPSLLYLQIQPDRSYRQVVDDLLRSLPLFYHADTGSISNDFIRGGDEVADSWYPFENGLIKYPMIAALAGSQTLKDNFLHAYQTATRMAHRYDHLFPIYFRTSTLDQRGAGTNYAVGGLYAWGGIIAHRLTGDPQYLQEARRAVEVLATVRAGSLFHEPQELSFGALAATELGMEDAARYLLFEQLRMFYWYSDPSQKDHDIRGMVQAAASILYPAFKENVEAILPWTAIMRRGLVVDALLRFMDQQRRNNFYYFQACRAAAGPPSPLPFIPYENLGTLELGGRTGVVGKEIYGSGEVLWLYLMFEGLGASSDRDLMLVSLDLLDAFDAGKFPARELNFILFNPMPVERETEVTIPAARGAAARLTVEGQPSRGAIRVKAGGYLRLHAQY